MNSINKPRLKGNKKSIVMWVLKWLTVQSKNGGKLKWFDNKDYVLWECSFNVYENKWKLQIEDQKWRSIPALDHHVFDNSSHDINLLKKGIKFPCKEKGDTNLINTKIFCTFAKFH